MIYSPIPIFTDHDFQQQRERLLDRLLVLLALVLFPSLIFLGIRSFYFGWNFNSSLQISLYVIFIVFAWQRRRIPYFWRAGLMVGLWWLSAASSLLLMGPLLEGRTMMVLLSLFTMLLLPMSIGWGSIILVALTVATIATAVLWFEWQFDADYAVLIDHPLYWIFSAYNLSIFSGIAAYMVWEMIHRLRTALAQSREYTLQLEETQQLARLGSWHYDIQHDIFSGSKQFYHLFGLPSGAQYSFKQMNDFVLSEDQPQVQEVFQRCIEDGAAYRLECRVKVGKDVFWLLVYGHCKRDSHHRINELFGTVQDISAYKHAEHALRESEERFRQFADNIDAVFWVRTPQQILYINPAYETVWGRTCASLYENPYSFIESIHPDDKTRIITAMQEELKNSGTFNQIYRIIRPDQSIRWIHARSYPVLATDGGTIRLTGIATDISKRRQAESELVHAREAAEAANRAKSAFLANMSHELRTPLNAIMGYAQILAKNCDLSTENRHMAQIINRSGEHLLLLLNDILDLSKIEAGRYDLSPIPSNLKVFLQSLVEIFTIRTQQKGLEFYKSFADNLPTMVLMDERRVRQIVLNLLSNAIKFTESGFVRLECTYYNGRLYLSVTDSGIGIAPQRLKNIFQPFQHSGDDRYKMQGTGLGLAISHKLATLMDGKLSVSSVTAQGSRFQLEILLPLLNHNDSPAPQTNAPTATLLPSEHYEQYQHNKNLSNNTLLKLSSNKINLSLEHKEQLRAWISRGEISAILNCLNTLAHDSNEDVTELLELAKNFRLNELRKKLDQE
jgi:PAS domain S-box-containing protein